MSERKKIDEWASKAPLSELVLLIDHDEGHREMFLWRCDKLHSDVAFRSLKSGMSWDQSFAEADRRVGIETKAWVERAEQGDLDLVLREMHEAAKNVE